MFNKEEVVQISNFIQSYKYNNVNKGIAPNEFEIRFGFFKQNKKGIDCFTPEITRKQYLDIKKYLDTHGVLCFETFEDKYIDSSQVQKIVSNNKTIYRTKNKINKLDIYNYNLRLAESEELEADFFDENNIIYYRNLKRISYNFSLFKCDLFLENKSDKISYSFELELNPQFVNELVFNILEINIKIFIKILQELDNDTLILSQNETNHVKNSYNKITKMDYFRFIGYQPHTINKNKFSNKDEYAVSYKLDGERMLLFIDNNYNCYYITKKSIRKTNIRLSSVKNCILDGEMYKGVYHIFDILYYNSNKVDNPSHSLHSKINIIESILNVEKDNINEKMIPKPFYFIDNKTSLYQLTQKMIKNLNEDHDGLIFTPVYANLCVLKWKPESLNTIDVKIKKKDNWIYLTCINKNKDYVVFSYSNNGGEEIISGTNKYLNLEEYEKYDSGTILEVSYDKNKKKFHVIRERADKVEPNYVDIAVDNFYNLFNVFDINTLKNQDSNILFNIIKEFSSIVIKCICYITNFFF